VKVRYTAEELGRISEEELVRHEFDDTNLAWARTLVVVFIFFLPFFVLVGVDLKELKPDAMISFTWVLFLNLLLLVSVALLRRRPRSHGVTTTFVLAFIVTEYLAVHFPAEPGGYLRGVMLAFLFCRFRVPAIQSYALHAFYIATGAVSMYLAPLPPHETVYEGAVFGVFVVLVLAAMGLQLAGTRRVRRELLEEWREPLREAREQLRMRDELHYARELQLAMLPEAPPRLDWLDLAASSIPAAEVGGDYYDFFPAGDRIAIVACDVAGHGMASGLVLAAMRGGFTMLRRSMYSPAAVLEQLHDLVLHTSRHRLLATAAMVMIDRDTRRATIASAGHPPAILRRNGSVSALELYAPPLGVRLPVTMTETTCDLAPGDLLVLHSDGIYEARNEAGETYGLERLVSLIETIEARAGAASVRDIILDDVESFRGAAPQDDDVTIVVAKLI
jgi:hypothetical protein